MSPGAPAQTWRARAQVTRRLARRAPARTLDSHSLMHTAARVTALLVLAGAAFPGCILEHYDPNGAVSFGWTIGGRWDSAACSELNTPLVHIVVRFDLYGVVVDDIVSCRALTVDYVLPRGWYRASLTLLDGVEEPVASSRETGRFYVSGGRDTFVTVDFDFIPRSVVVPVDTGSDRL